MIPRGRKVITPAELAELAGVPLRTWRRRDAPSFQENVPSLFDGRYLMYDLGQSLAYLDGRPVPALPTGEHPDDLLNDKEVAGILQVEPSTVRAYRQQGYLSAGEHPQGEDGQPITSIRVTRRRDVEERRAALPDSHVPGRRGRPGGSPLQSHVDELVKRGEVATDKEIAEAVGISRRHGHRLLQNTGRPVDSNPKSRRLARVKELLTQHGDSLSLREIAEDLGVSKTEAHRLVRAVREAPPIEPVTGD